MAGPLSNYRLLTAAAPVLLSGAWVGWHAPELTGRADAPSGGSATPVFYPDCRYARLAGAAPIYAGTPGYRPQMDGDGDGIACEPRPDDAGPHGSLGGMRRRRR